VSIARIVVMAMFAGVAAQVSAESPAQKLGVEVWMHGSDIETPRHAETRRLRDSIEAAVVHSSELQLSAANKGLLRVTIPQDVILAHDGEVTYVLFMATVSASRPAYTLEVTGFCRSNDLANCADNIVAALMAASRQLE
jgi:hypothetical protein